MPKKTSKPPETSTAVWKATSKFIGLGKIKKILLVKVGNEKRPAGPQDIETVRAGIASALEGKIGEELAVLVTHHALSMEVIDLAGCTIRRKRSKK